MNEKLGSPPREQKRRKIGSEKATAPTSRRLGSTKVVQAAERKVEATKKQVEAAKKEVESAERKVEAAERKVEAAKKEVEAAERKVEAAKKTKVQEVKQTAQKLLAFAVEGLGTAQKQHTLAVDLLEQVSRRGQPSGEGHGPTLQDVLDEVKGLRDELQNYCSKEVFEKVASNSVAIFRVEEAGEDQCIGGACIYSIDGKRFLLTSAHVLFDEVVDQDNNTSRHKWCVSGAQRLEIRRCKGEFRQQLEETHCVADHDLDIAVAKLNCKRSLGLEGCTDALPPPWRKPDLLLCGFSLVNWDFRSNPFPKPNLVTNTAAWKNPVGIVSYSCKSFRGDSGCPVITRSGKIVAVHGGTDDDKQRCKQSSGGEIALESSTEARQFAGDTLCVGVLTSAIDGFIRKNSVQTKIQQAEVVDFRSPNKSSKNQRRH